MVSHYIHGHKVMPRLAQVTKAIGLFLAFWLIIPTPLAVPGQQDGYLVNQGRSLVWITREEQEWTLPRIPVAAPIHQVLRATEGRFYVAGRSGLFVWNSTDGGWTQLFTGEVLAVAEVESDLLIGTSQGLLTSTNRGRIWQKVGLGLPADAVPLVIQAAEKNQRVMYVGTWRHGLFRSDDGGAQLEPINGGLPHAIGAGAVTPIRQLVIDPYDADTVFVSTDVNGIYKTVDGAQHWRPLKRGLPGPFSHRTYHPLLAISRTRPETLYAVFGYPVHSHLVENTVYKTTDGGQSWYPIHRLSDNLLYHSLTLIEDGPVELAIGFERGVIRVKDEGQHLEAGPYRKPSPLRSSDHLNLDLGEIAVLEDDGTLNQNFDLHNRSIEFAPTEGPGYVLSALGSSFEPDIGPDLMLGDNDSVEVTIPFPFPFYGTEVPSVFVNANGSVTFGRGDANARPSRAGAFALFRLGPPKIAALWEDYDPGLQGGVHVKVAMDPQRVVITWDNLRRSSSLLPDSSTFQIVLFPDGRFRLNYGGLITNPSGLIGVSPGRSTASSLVVNLSRDLPQTIENRPLLEFFTGRGLDIQATARKFYETHPDAYDQLVVFGSSQFRTNLAFPAQAFAFNAPIRNDVLGIGRPAASFNGGPEAFGSGGRLQSFLNMNRLALYPDNPHQEIANTFNALDIIGHETAHRWLAYLLFDTENGTPSFGLLASDLTHWSFFFNSIASLMQGNLWLDNEDGTFTSEGATSRFSALDEYAMGLRLPEDVNTVYFINQPTGADGRDRNTLPELDVTVGGSRVDVTMDQIISRNGPRLPAAGWSPTSLNQAYVLVIPEGATLPRSEVEKVDRLRQAFEPYFNQITGRRAVVETRLLPGEPELAIEAATVSPPLLTPGETVTVGFTVRNRGSAAAGLVLNDIRLSSMEGSGGEDQLLKRITTLSLAPDEAGRLVGIPVRVPTTAPPGAQFITLIVDAGNAAEEMDEANNRFVIPVTVMGGGEITRVEEAEPNDTRDQATLITPDAIIAATLDPARDNDFYTFSAEPGQSLTVDINSRSFIPPSSANTQVSLFDSRGRELAKNDDFAQSPDSFLQFVIPRSGQYFVKVNNVPPGEGGPEFMYQAVVTLRSVESLSEAEPNDSPETANEIVPDAVISGVLGSTGDEDYYSFMAGTGQRLIVEVEAQSLVDASAADTLLSLFDEVGNLIAENDDVGGSSDSAFEVRLPRASRYFIRVRDVAGRGGPEFTYRVAVRLATVQEFQEQDE